MRHCLALFIALATLLCHVPAAAHRTPNSEITLDFGSSEVRADVIIPLGDYAFATGNAVDGSAANLRKANEYLRGKVRIAAPSGEHWDLSVVRLEFVRKAGPPDLHAILTFTPPPGQNARRLVIDWRAVVDVVPSHFALFVVRSDFSAGVPAEKRQILGMARTNQFRLAVDRGTASYLAGFSAAVMLGAHHIAEGHDHLLFLVALLIPAPLIARNGRWAEVSSPRRALWRLAGIVTAFTIGHSVTLIGGVMLGWRLPEQLVEMAIAASILISAIHAWRPLFPGREAWVAGSFGLVHGLAFATLADGFGLGLAERILATLGFNVGVELFQLLVVAAVMPLLFMLAAGRSYDLVRTILAAFAGVAALGWIAERATGEANMVAGFVQPILAHSLWGVALATMAVLAFRMRPAG